MKTNLLTRFISMLLPALLVQQLVAQPIATVAAPKCYANPVVVMIPVNSLHLSLDPKDTTEVMLYVVSVKDGKVDTIVKNNALVNYRAYRARVHVRGDATALDPKKQFEVKLFDDKAQEETQLYAGKHHHKKKHDDHFLDMKHNGKDWVFNDCGAVDLSLMRNIITFSTQSRMQQYSPQWKWFELFVCDSTASIQQMDSILQNNYWGLYLNFDKILFNKHRVSQPYQYYSHKNSIYQHDAILQLNQASSKYYHLPLNGSEPLIMTAGVQVYEPKKEDLKNRSDSAGIINGINQWYYNSSATNDTSNWGGQMNNYYVRYLLNANSDTSGKALARKHIHRITNYTSFAVYFLINELSKDPDGYHKSTFMVKAGNTCYAGPLWDKNKSYGNLYNNPDTSFFYNRPSGWLFHDSSNTINAAQAPVWWYVLLDDPQFCTTVWNTWTQHYSPNGALAYTTFKAMIDTQLVLLKTPVSANDTSAAALWRNNQCWANGLNTPAAYAAQIAQLENYLSKRLLWMNANLPVLLKVPNQQQKKEKH